MRWPHKLLTVMVALFVGFLLVEGGLRLLGISYPRFYDYDPQLGARLRPGVAGYWLKEGGGYVSINRDGLRDREHAIPHPPNTLRIAVLGDSMAEAMQVNREEAFWAVMEKELAGCPDLQGRAVEVINFGQSGFGTSQELLALRHRVWKYEPDLVLLAFFTGNDVADNSRALKGKAYHPYHHYEGGELVLHDRGAREQWEKDRQQQTWGRRFYNWRLDTFRTEQLISRVQEVVGEWRQRQAAAQPGPAATDGEVGLADAVYREPTDDTWREAWRVTEGVLSLMKEEVRQKGARFYVVVLTNGIQVNPDPAVRESFARKLGVADLFYPDRRLERFCGSQGIPVLLLAPAFQEGATRERIFFHGFGKQLGMGHWNQQGHRLAGSLLAGWLCGHLPSSTSPHPP